MNDFHSDIKLFMRLEPDAPKLTHQNGVEPAINPRTHRPMLYKTQELRELEKTFISLLRPFAPAVPWACPIHLTTIWYFRSSDRRSLAQGWKTTSPDTDNLVKTLKDCMTRAGFYRDDAFVCLETIAKRWASPEARHGVEIRLHDLRNDD